MKKQYLYGMTGFLSLLGFVGIFTEERVFLGFFAFAVDFQYFFMPSDEMMDAYMLRSAALGFYAGMMTSAAVTVVSLLRQVPGSHSILSGFTMGWVAAVVVHALSIAWYSCREGWGASHD